ncbi:hypothetical protein INT48_005644 [Thamnidium elegans]|uniref:Uncharacterized protein n=1 Tax=Thamnidium elegans TaxID=101142 RepID=A0A8H7VVW2_9FUNG|nr:hypothetical protein INT48_005644 [Thamnidium elegans]
MDNVKENLFNYEYWENTKPEKYDITNYDIALCKNEIIEKRAAHACLGTDIETLLLIDLSAATKSALTQLKDRLKKINKNTQNKTFWDDVAPALAKEKLGKTKHDAELNETCRTVIGGRTKRISEEESSSSSSRPRPLPILKTAKECVEQTTPREHDEVYVKGSKLSVGTLIKKKAIDYHDKHVLGLKLEDGEYGCMANGLSSILDLSDHSQNSQKTIFNQGDWSLLNINYKEKYKTLEECPDQIVLLHWGVVIKNILDSRDINKGLSYLYRIFPNQIKKNYFFCFKILEHILNLLSNYDEMLVKDNGSTENDYIRIVWSEILEQLFRPKCNVKVITGETVNPISTLNRKEQYGVSATKDEANKTIGFKIDIRLVYNKSTGGCPSIDLCAGEAAKDESIAKTIGDRSKVSREAKDNLDLLLTILPSNMSQYCVGWSLLITGATCSISCLYLDANGLYVNIPKYDFSLPTTILELSGAIDMLKHLLTLRREIYFMADIIQNEMAKPPSIINPLGRAKPLAPFTEKIFWKRDTYYPPPAGMRSVRPKYLFGFPPAESLLNKLKAISKDTDVSSNTNNPPFNDIIDEECDEFGWVRQQNRWYNVKTKVYSVSSPYGDDSDNES